MIPKFRAWEESAEEGLQMWSWKEMHEMDLGQFFNNPKYELMQSTGLKDKNGIEIFEGDVISELSEQGEDWANHILAEVVWHKAGFYGKEKGHEPEYPITEFVKGEVIGNIWENPELVEVAE